MRFRVRVFRHLSSAALSILPFWIKCRIILRPDAPKASERNAVKCGDPLCIPHIRLAPWYILHVSGIDYKNIDFSVKAWFQHLIDWQPADPCAFHSNMAAICLQYPVPQFPHFWNQGAEGAYLNLRGTPNFSFGKARDDDIPVDI